MVSPVLFMMVMAGFQFGGLMMVQNVITAAAREGGRVASLSGTSSSETVENAVRDRLSLGGVNPDLVTIEVSPAVLDNLAVGAEVTVSVSTQISDMAFYWPDYMASPTLSAELIYNRE